MPIDVTDVSHAVSKDIEYFQQNLSRTDKNQIVNYTWEKSPEESPSFYKQLEPIVYDREDLTLKMDKNTLDQMAITKGFVQPFKHNKWETDGNGQPKTVLTQPSRHGIHLSSMTQ